MKKNIKIKKRKNGFTLIELLAVILILSIVVIFAVPIVLNVIKDSKENANLRSIEGYARAIKQEYYNQSMDGSIPTIDEEFLNKVNKGGENITCQSILYSDNNGIIMYKCEFKNVNKNYCYSNETHYECSDDEFLTAFIDNGGIMSESLISLLLKQYKDGNQTGLIKDKDNENLYYYTGTDEQVTNNFLWYGGHQWRVIEFDTNAKTLTLITQQPLTTISVANNVWTTKENYESSYINNWLNDYFWNSLDSNIQANIKESTFNIGILGTNDMLVNKKVGLLNSDQYLRSGGSNSFLDIKDKWWLGNKDTTHIYYVNNSGVNMAINPTYTLGIRPVIKISDLIICDGVGTLTSNYKTLDKSSNINDVQIGEYINVPYNGNDNYCGTDKLCTFRVVNKDANSVKVILNGLLPNKSSYGNSTTITTNHTIYSPLKSFANNISNDYRYTGNKSFYIGDYLHGTNYINIKDEILSTNIGLPTVGEMFSGNDISIGFTKKFVDINTIENSTVSGYYATMNRGDSSRIVCIVDYDGYSDNFLTLSIDNFGIRPVIYLKTGLNFVSGKGTAQAPYELK